MSKLYPTARLAYNTVKIRCDCGFTISGTKKKGVFIHAADDILASAETFTIYVPSSAPKKP